MTDTPGLVERLRAYSVAPLEPTPITPGEPLSLRVGPFMYRAISEEAAAALEAQAATIAEQAGEIERLTSEHDAALRFILRLSFSDPEHAWSELQKTVKGSLHPAPEVGT